MVTIIDDEINTLCLKLDCDMFLSKERREEIKIKLDNLVSKRDTMLSVLNKSDS